MLVLPEALGPTSTVSGSKDKFNSRKHRKFLMATLVIIAIKA